MTSRLEAPGSENTLNLPLRGRAVSRLVVDYRLTLQFLGGDDDLDLAIATPFTVVDEGQANLVNPEHTESLGPVLTLLRQVVESVSVHEDGGLELVFAHGPCLSLPPDPNYEAWESISASGAKLVCLPGGGLAVWAARG